MSLHVPQRAWLYHSHNTAMGTSTAANCAVTGFHCLGAPSSAKYTGIVSSSEKRDSNAHAPHNATSHGRRSPAISASASKVNVTALTWAMNHTSPNVAHHNKSVPAKRNAQIHAMLARGNSK